MARTFVTVQEALDYMQSLDSDEYSDEGSIICLPPDPGEVTDEENIADNDLGEVIPVDVSGQFELKVKQREGRCLDRKINRKRKIPIRNDISDEDTSMEGDILEEKIYWNRANQMLAIESEEMSRLEETRADLAVKSPYELFQLYFDSEIMNLFTEETLRYALQKKNNAFSLSEMDIQKFIGIVLFSGYHVLPQEDLYWGNSEDCNLPFIQNLMNGH